MKKMMTPQQALAMMTNLESEVKAGNIKPEKMVAACNRVARESIIWAINAQKRDTHLLGQINEIKKALGIEVAQGAPTTNGAPSAPMPQAPTQRYNQDGTPMDPKQAALEDAMDAAINAGVQAGEIQRTTAMPTSVPAATEAAPMPEVVTAPEPAPAPAPTPPPPAPSRRDAAMDAVISAARK